MEHRRAASESVAIRFACSGCADSGSRFTCRASRLLRSVRAPTPRARVVIVLPGRRSRAAAPL